MRIVILKTIYNNNQMSIQRIPKIFFQTSKKPLEPYLSCMIQSMLSSEWKYIYYSDIDILHFIESHPLEEFPKSIDFFKRLKRGEHKADFFRYYFLYVKGGVFMDSDAMIYQPIDTIIKDYSFFSVKSDVVPGTIFQGILGSEPRNPIIYESLKFLYTMDIQLLDTNYHILCKEMYKVYTTVSDNPTYHLYNEIMDSSGDKTIDTDQTVLFRHYWRNKEGIPNTIRSKNLIYCCVFYNKDYLKLLDLLLKSIITYSSIDSFDFLVITQNDFKPYINDLSIKLNIVIKTYILDISTFFQAACARLSIFNYSNITDYEKILYIDTDILITSDLKPVFDLTIQEKLYALESGEINSHNFGGQFFDFNTINSNTSGINSGTLLFLNSQSIKDLFSRILLHIDEYTKEGTKPPYCMDQPFINYHAIKDSLYDNKTLLPYISLFEGHHPEVSYKEKTICHFSYPIGNFGDKYRRMSEFFITKLKTSSKVTYLDIIGKKYTWSSGYIKFIYNIDSCYKIQTSWGEGTFSILNDTMVYVEWANHGHILKFNSDYTEYASIRTRPADFDFIRGRLIDTYLNIYGDSHALLLFRDLQVPHRNLFAFGKTMHSLGRDKQITNFFQGQLNKDTIYCFVYGEVDVRAHIGKQVYYGKHHETVCKELVSAYFRTIQQTITEYKDIIIVGVPPPVDSEDHTHIHTPTIPFIGTNSDRVIYTNYMNTLLKSYCAEYKYLYLNPFSYYTRNDGCLNYSLSDNCLHIGKNEYFLKAFYEVLKLDS